VIAVETIIASIILDGVDAASMPRDWPDVTGVAIDSRLVQPGNLFVALSGESTDGHLFVEDALRRGAMGALVRRSWANDRGQMLDMPMSVITDRVSLLEADPGRALLFAVDDPLVTLQRLSKLHRQHMQAKVIGITGSVGKTSVKEVAAAVLRRQFRTLYSGKSYNNEIGVPLTLLRLEPEHEVAVVEMGTYGPGEIAFLCRLAQPHFGIVTNVGVSHLERMKTPDTVAVAKSELVEALPADGVAILNIDDHRVRAMEHKTRAHSFFYGLDPAADLWADAIEPRGLDGVAFTVHYGDQEYRFETPLLGGHAVYVALPAIALGLLLGLDWDTIAAGLCDRSIQGRITVVRGVNGATILDDSYNASPASCQAALDLLARVPGRRTAIFGDMAELGPIELEGHRAVGKAAVPVVDRLVVVGEKARWIAEAAREEPNAPEIMIARSNTAAADLLRPLLGSNDVILVKGARVAYTEQIVDALRDVGDGQ
jgi:UDP-N-acetylmuramoyl-tripeptide--D-alanyl-D-alanine ligase